MAMSTTARTLQRLRKEGITADKAEYYLACPGQKFGRRKDLFGIIDVVALDVENKETIGIQCTTVGALSQHKKKIREAPEMLIKWLLCRNRYVIHAWQKKGHRWQCRKIEACYNLDMTDGYKTIAWVEDKSENRSG